ncbi:unnamed protein product [Sphacelaria rigidula]
MDTSELFAHFDNGLAKILHMAEAPQLQDLEALSAVVKEALEVRMELVAMGLELLEKMARSPRVVARLPATKLAVQVFGDALQELLRQPTPPPPPARVTVEDITGDTPVAATAAAGNPAEPSTMAGVGAAAPALAKSQVREQDRPQTPTDDWSGTRAASSASVPTVAPTSAGGDSGGGVTSATTATASSPATISVPPPSLAESSTAQSFPPPAAGRLVQSAVEGHAVVADPSLDTGTVVILTRFRTARPLECVVFVLLPVSTV